MIYLMILATLVIYAMYVYAHTTHKGNFWAGLAGGIAGGLMIFMVISITNEYNKQAFNKELNYCEQYGCEELRK